MYFKNISCFWDEHKGGPVLVTYVCYDLDLGCPPVVECPAGYTMVIGFVKSGQL